MSEAAKPRLLLMGASGRLGRMTLSHWRREPRSKRAFEVVGQYRQNPPSAQDLCWSPLEDGPAPLLTRISAHVDSEGPFAALAMLSGVTPRADGGMAAMDDNARLAECTLEAASLAGISRVLIVSSSAVYGAGSGTAFNEDAPLAPANPYGAAKAAMETLCRARVAADKTELCLLRIGNVAGADALLLNVAAHPERPMTVNTFADGRGPIRSYIGPATLADVLAHLALTRAPLPVVLNIAAPAPISMESLALALGHPVVHQDAAHKGHQHVILDCARLATLFPFAPTASSPAAMVAEWQEITAQ